MSYLHTNLEYRIKRDMHTTTRTHTFSSLPLPLSLSFSLDLFLSPSLSLSLSFSLTLFLSLAHTHTLTYTSSYAPHTLTSCLIFTRAGAQRACGCSGNPSGKCNESASARRHAHLQGHRYVGTTGLAVFGSSAIYSHAHTHAHAYTHTHTHTH